jgi:hypothetical protein
MSTTATNDASAVPGREAKPFVTINVITPKSGAFEAFMERQLAQHHRTRGKVEGLLGGRLFRSLDRRSIVLVAAFETQEHARRFREDKGLVEHIVGMQPLIESAVAGAYETAYEVGDI